MFLDNKYTNLYYRLIVDKESECGEVHHIIPKSLGGSDDTSNLVKVSPRVHFILHKLLVKMVKTEKEKVAMSYALFMMMNRQISNYTSKTYEEAKRIVSENMKQNNPMHNVEVLKKRTGQKRSAETKRKISEANYRRWEGKSRPVREFNCPICDTPIKTRLPTKTTCSKKCSGIFQYRK